MDHFPEPCEVFVTRPDRLVLCRGTDLGQLADVARHVLAGDAPRGPRAEQKESTTPPLESVWLTLSAALDDAGESDRESFLVRLAVLLGEGSGRHAFEDCTAIAAQPEGGNHGVLPAGG